MHVVALDIGQGDAILIISPNGKTMLVDGGNSSRDAAEVILPYLQDRGVDTLDVLVLTHPDADHVGGLPAVLQGIPTGVAVATGQVHTTQVYAEFLQELQKARDERGTRVIRGRVGAEVPFDPDVRLQVLGPDQQAIDGDDKNNASIVLHLSYGQISVMLTGDAEIDEEDWLLDRGGELGAQVLKVSHHGSRTASGDAFLKAVAAGVGLISCGTGNRYGHPHAEVLASLARHGVEVYRTDQQGTLDVIIDGRNVECASQDDLRRDTIAVRGVVDGGRDTLDEPSVLRGTVDSLEADWALLALDDGQRLDWPRDRLPPDAVEGMVVLLRLDKAREMGAQGSAGMWEGVVGVRAQGSDLFLAVQLGDQSVNWPVMEGFSAGDAIAVSMHIDAADTDRRRQEVQRLVDDLFD